MVPRARRSVTIDGVPADAAPEPFAGWPPAALDFLRALEADNDREWFAARRAEYDRVLRGPAFALAAELADFGRAKAFRPYRDTRFHPGPPIKENVAIALGSDGAGGAYVDLSLDGLLVGAGLYDPAPDQVERWRAAVDDGRRAGALTRALRAAQAAGLAPGDPELKRAPRGWPADHPRIELLRRRRFAVFARHPLEPWLHAPEAGDRIRGQLDAARPLLRWLATHVGPSQRPSA